MKLLYLGSLCNEDVFNSIVQDGNMISQAAYKYEKQLISQMTENDFVLKSDVEIISSLPFRTQEICACENLYSGINIRYVWNNRNQITDIFSCWKRVKEYIDEWEEKTRGERRIILAYATDMILLPPALISKSFHRDLKIITICSEVPRFRNYNHTSRWKGFLIKEIYNFLNESMDGYIFASKHMQSVCNKKNKPWITIEGLPEIIEYPELSDVEDSEEKIIYAGGLARGYGIEELLESIGKVRSEKVKLQICGSGELVEQVKEYCKKDERISYLGVLPNKEVLELERHAAILINPRKPDLQLTKYSFPSKTLEYFSNGHAVSLISRLEGIPEEYYQWCFLLSEVTSQEIANQIDTILAMTRKERFAIAQQAYNFVKKEKSSSAQVKKICAFLEGQICKENRTNEK